MKSHALVFTTLLALLSPTIAGAGDKPLEQVMATQVAGTVAVAPDGSVAGLVVSTPLAPQVRPALEAKLRALRFVPVRIAGQPVQAKTAFRLDLVARKQDVGLRASMDGIGFFAPKGEQIVRADGELAPILGRDISPPRIPEDLLRNGKSGGVEVAVRISDDGRVEQAVIVRSARQHTAFTSVV